MADAKGLRIEVEVDFVDFWGRPMSKYTRANISDRMAEYLANGVKLLLDRQDRYGFAAPIGTVGEGNLPAVRAAVREALTEWDAQFLRGCVMKATAFARWAPTDAQRPLLHGILLQVVDWAEDWEVRQQRIADAAERAKSINDWVGKLAEKEKAARKRKRESRPAAIIPVEDLGDGAKRVIRE